MITFESDYENDKTNVSSAEHDRYLLLLLTIAGRDSLKGPLHRTGTNSVLLAIFYIPYIIENRKSNGIECEVIGFTFSQKLRSECSRACPRMSTDSKKQESSKYLLHCKISGGPQLTQRLSAFCGNEACKSMGRGQKRGIAMTLIQHPPIYNDRLFTNINIISGKNQLLRALA